MKANDIINHLNNWASLELAEEWDNSGIQLGNIDEQVKKVLLVMDVDRSTLNFAIEGGYNMIISHHPLIFKALKKITSLDNQGKLIMDIIKNDIIVYSGHTNFDVVADGVSHQLARALGINKESVLKKISNTEEEIGYGIVGTIDRTNLESYARLVKDKLNIKGLVSYGELNKEIEKIGLCGGSGSSFIVDAAEKKVDLYITGDIKYHDAQLAQSLAVNILDIGHFESEKYILEKVREVLMDKFKELKVDIIGESSILKNYL